MIPRVLKIPQDTAKSFFLFGTRGTGKSTWAKSMLPGAKYIDLHNVETFKDLARNPSKIFDLVSTNSINDWVIIDGILEIPLLSFFVKNLIEEKKHRFALLTSSSLSIDNKLANLLDLKLPVYNIHPLTAHEMAGKFNIEKSLQFGHLPACMNELNPQSFLQIYLYLFLREEILHEKLTENFALFTRFLEVLSLYQCCEINIQAISRLTSTPQNVTVRFFEILEALFFGMRLNHFDKNSDYQPKFYFFDVGVFKTVQAKKLSACNKDLSDVALETLVFQELRATNDYFDLKYNLSYWTSPGGAEVTFVAQNPDKLCGIAIRNKKTVDSVDFSGLIAFYDEHPSAKVYMIYAGEKRYFYSNVEVIPIGEALSDLPNILGK